MKSVECLEADITAYVFSIANVRFSDFDLKEYHNLCSLIRNVETPSIRMRRFLSLDVLSERKLVEKIAALIKDFDDNITTEFYWSEYQKICNLVDELFDPDVFKHEMYRINQLLDNRDKIFHLTALMSQFCENIEHSDKSIDYRKQYQTICDKVEQLEFLTKKLESFKQMGFEAVFKQSQEKRLHRELGEEIQHFQNKLQTSDYVSYANYKALCRRINALSYPTEDMLKFIQLDNYVAQYARDKELRQDIDNQIENSRGLSLEKFRNVYGQIERQIRSLQNGHVYYEKLREVLLDKVVLWFEKHVTKNSVGEPYKIDKKQAEVIIDKHKDLLVRALAGSGKTGTIIAKIIYLVGFCGIEPSAITVFAFNRAAANEINTRLKEIRIDGKTFITNSVATTFHAFAFNNVEHDEVLLEERDKFIQDIINSNISKQDMYEISRSLPNRIERHFFDDPNDFYQMLRAQQYKTLNGEYVKSSSEKFICDFLFEHGIEYFYEPTIYTRNLLKITRPEYRTFFSNKDALKPDFYLPEYNLVWEHWAITGNESVAQINSINRLGVIGPYDEYQKNMNWKKTFYGREWVDNSVENVDRYSKRVKDWGGVIETYNPGVSREEFEQYLTQKLNGYGVFPQKLSEEEIVSKVWEKHINDFTKLVVQFIDRAEQGFLSDIEELERKIKDIAYGTRERKFLDIALGVYKLYMERLHSSNRYELDFNMLMHKVAESMRNNPEKYVDISRKKYIFIDEYQDFSRLFFNVIDCIRGICPHCNIVCVGDEFQSINRFAGADIKYFQNFETYFGVDPYILTLDNNYRSSKEVIDISNSFLINKLGLKTGLICMRRDVGTVKAVDVSKEAVYWEQDVSYRHAMRISEKREPEINAVRCLKAVVAVIEKNKNKKTIKILHRNNDMSFWGFDLDKFLDRVKAICLEQNMMTSEEFDNKVSISTIHSSKGQEADVVILLEANKSIIPSFHPDSCLFMVFGETPDVVLMDQKKLFYVALTRAKEQLWILFDGKNKSSFLDGLDVSV